MQCMYSYISLYWIPSMCYLSYLQAHKAIAECQVRLAKQNRHVSVITQNIDELHKRAGSTGILELHGQLFGFLRCLLSATEIT